MSKGDLKILLNDTSAKEYTSGYVYAFEEKKEKKSLKTTETSRSKDKSKFMRTNVTSVKQNSAKILN